MAKQLFYGSINLSELIDKAKDKHSAFKKADNGNIYVAVQIWETENDKYGNDAGIQLSPAKDSTDKKTYVGNLKKTAQEQKQEEASSFLDGLATDLPF